MKYVRIVAEPVPDNPDALPITIDAIIDGAGRILGKQTLFGVAGSFKDKEEGFYPFTLNANGEMDFGSDYEWGARSGDFDLRKGAIELNKLLTLKAMDWGVQRFRIRQIVELPPKTG